MTQLEVATAVGVSQPTYQRWESGAIAVPDNKINRLAKALSAPAHQLLGKPEPFDLFGIDRTIPDERTYFGEAAIHFTSGSPPLLLPLSEAERSNLYRALGGDEAFIEVSSLDNRTVFVRRAAIADLFFSSEAYDDYGPADYGDQHLGIHPDDAFWKIVEHLDCIECLDDEFDEKEIDAAMAKASLSESDLDALVASGDVQASERDKVRKEADEVTDRFLTRARHVEWQFASQQPRHASISESKDIYENFSLLTSFEEDDEFMRISPEGYHRSILINLAAVDYLSVPSHKFREGQIESAAEELGESDLD